MRVAILGSGYVGLVSGTCFAEFGHEVTCIDLDSEKVARLKAGMVPIYEPGLEPLIERNVRAGRLSFTTAFAEAVAVSDVVFIAVGTPSRRGDGYADLSYVFAAAEDIAAALNGFTVVVTKSTVPVGTGDEVERIIREKRPDADFAVVSNPEFLREGSAIDDFKRPDRIVIGSTDSRAIERMQELYRPLRLNQAPILVTGRRSAELAKYAANAFLATKITFINEIADLCENVGAEVQEIARAIGLDNRIGPKFLNPSPGYGGSCFPKDTLALIKTSQDHDAPLRIVETVAAVNETRKRAMARRIISACGGSVRGKTIALLGLAFKPNTDDMRASPAIDIVTALQDAGAIIRAYDPEAMEQARKCMQGILYAQDPYDCARGADALAIVTPWDQFRALNLETMGELLSRRLLVDFHNIYRPDEVQRLGFQYISIGRPAAKVAELKAVLEAAE